MRMAGMVAMTMALGCGGNYGHVPVFGRAEACHEVVDVFRAHALACGAKQDAAFDVLQRSCDNMIGESPLPADTQPCLDAIAIQPCSEVDKIPKACRDAFAGLGQ